MDGEAATGEAATETPGVDPVAKGCGIGCLALLAALVAFAVYAFAFPSDDNDDASAYVEIACRDWVKDRLKAPSTAEFYDEATSKVGNRYVVNGSVDSQNSFGGMVRNRYRCEATHSGEETRLISLTGLTN